MGRNFEEGGMVGSMRKWIADEGFKQSVRYLKKLGINQIEMARELRIHPRRLGRYERCESHPPMVVWIKIQRYAKQFGIQLGGN